MGFRSSNSFLFKDQVTFSSNFDSKCITVLILSSFEYLFANI